MVKNTKIYLICDKKYYKTLWQLQHNTRDLKNKAVQILWEWNNFSQDFKKENKKYPKAQDIVSYKMFSGYIYNQLKDESILNTSNLSSTIRLVERAFKANVKDYLKGTKSVLNFKENQPLDLHNRSISLIYDNNFFYADLALMNQKTANELNDGSCRIKFRLLIKDNSTRTIVERCYDNVYSISGSKINYDKKKKMWFLNLAYQFENKQATSLDRKKILGVDVGVKKALVASVFGDYDRLAIEGNEIHHIRAEVETRKISLLRQGKFCGEGRIGHGYKKRVEPLDKISDKISRSRDTINHKYSKALIDYALKKGCGTIQMEELSGISERDSFLKNWSYFDLQQKIKYKAEEQGMEVVFINPQYTSQRCSKCGYIDSENRKTQENFLCVKCGYKANADYNASQNIAINGIEEIIKSAQSKA